MNKHVILMGAAAALLLSCAREADFAEIQPGETITFTAGWADAETRTILQPDGTSVWWEPAAQVSAFFGDKASGRFTSTNTEPNAIVDFKGSLSILVGSMETENSAQAYWAVYPYNASNTCDGESVTLTVPATQTAAAGTFANKMFPSIATSTNFYLAFYNVCGGVRFTVYNEGILSVTFKANNGEPLAGKVQVGFDGVPVVKNVIEGTDEVMVKAPDGGFVPGTYYFATLLPQTLTKGMTVTFRKSVEKAITSLDNSITINRARFGKLDEKDKELEFFTEEGDRLIEFADQNVKTRLVAAFDTNGDGELSYNEAAAATSIQGVLTNKNIESFDEFQYFTGVTAIPDAYFKDWTKLSSIILPRSISDLGRYAFRNCSNLTSVTLPDDLTNLGYGTFYNCVSLSRITLPKSLIEIGAEAFYRCTGLDGIVIPDTVTSIDRLAFSRCTSLSSIIIPESVTSLGDETFSNCSNLTSVTLPDNLTNLGYATFYNCVSLSKITLPKNLIEIGAEAFYCCTGLDGIVIPDTVTNIDRLAFSGCTSLSSIIIPESVTSLGEEAFSNCSGLVSIVIPEGITSISGSLLSGCTDLETVILPESTLCIGYSSFAGCTSLTSITIPKNVTSIYSSICAGCTSLSTITLLPTVPPAEFFPDAFDGTRNIPIYVPAESVEDYRTARENYAFRFAAIGTSVSLTPYQKMLGTWSVNRGAANDVWTIQENETDQSFWVFGIGGFSADHYAENAFRALVEYDSEMNEIVFKVWENTEHPWEDETRGPMTALLSGQYTNVEGKTYYYSGIGKVIMRGRLSEDGHVISFTPGTVTSAGSDATFYNIRWYGRYTDETGTRKGVSWSGTDTSLPTTAIPY